MWFTRSKLTEGEMISETIDLLGLRAKDKISGFEGVVSSASFDLYGCVCLAIAPGVLADGKLGDSHWFDVQRLTIFDGTRVMDVPDFASAAVKPKDFKHGAAEKPIR